MKNTIIIVSVAATLLFAGNWIVTKHYANQVINARSAPAFNMGPGGRGGQGFMMDTNRMARMEEMRKQRDAREQEYLKTLSPTDKANYEKMKKQMEEQRGQGRGNPFDGGFGGPPRDR